jgi:hypothetical protein
MNIYLFIFSLSSIVFDTISFDVIFSEIINFWQRFMFIQKKIEATVVLIFRFLRLGIVNGKHENQERLLIKDKETVIYRVCFYL